MTVITSDVAVPAGSDLPALIDYQATIANDARCVGIWDFTPAAWTLDGNRRVMSVANMKTGGLPLVQSNPTRRAYKIFDPDIGWDAAQFVSGEQHFYQLDGYNFVSKSPFTVIAICRPIFSSDPQMIAGMYNGSPDVAALFQTGLPRTFRMLIQDRTANQEGRAGWNYVVGASTRPGVKLAAISANDQSTTLAIGGASSDPAGNLFTVSHPAAAFGGVIRQVQFYSADLMDDLNVDLLNRALAYTTEIMGAAA